MARRGPGGGPRQRDPGGITLVTRGAPVQTRGMTSPDPDAPGAETSRVTRAVVGVVVGIAIFACVGVVGYVAVVAVGMRGWPDAYDPADPGTTVADPAGEPTGLGRETGLDASNEAYRQRSGTSEDDAEAARSVPAVQAALDPVADGSAVDGAEVVAALADAGFEDVQVTGPTTPLGDPATTVGVGVAVPGGCVYGAVTPDAVTLDAGGPIADGGCLEMPTH